MDISVACCSVSLVSHLHEFWSSAQMSSECNSYQWEVTGVGAFRRQERSRPWAGPALPLSWQDGKDAALVPSTGTVPRNM